MIKNKMFMAVCAGAFAATFGGAALAADQPLIVRNDAVVVCRSKQCKSARNMMTQEFLFNKLGSLLKNNVNRKVLFCDADKDVRVCLNDGINFYATVGVTDAVVHIPSALVVDAKAVTADMTQKFVLDYNMELGDTFPSCQASLNQMRVLSADKISIETPGFECRFTENGMTVVNASYEVDYIDFDYGILGAHYTVAVGQVSRGGQSGYALLRFENSANANNEVMENCGCVEGQNPPCQCGKPDVVVQEKVVTQYEVAPIEVFVKTKAPVAAGQVQNVRINGVDVPNVPVVSDPAGQMGYAGKPIAAGAVPAKANANTSSGVTTTQILRPGVPVIVDVEEEVAPGQVRAASNWDK